MRALRAGAAAVLAGSTLVGCWDQSAFDAARSRWNPGETDLSSDRVVGLTELWDTPVPNAWNVGRLLSVGGSVYATSMTGVPPATSGAAAVPAETVLSEASYAAPSAVAIPPPPADRGALVTAIDASSGGVRWSTDLETEGVVASSGYPLDAAYVDGGVVVSHVRYWPVPYPDGGSVRLDPGTGAIVDRQDMTATVLTNLAVVDGALTFERVRGAGSPSTVHVSVPWRYEAVAYSGPDSPTPVGLRLAPTFAIAGDRVLWSFDDTAMGFSPACPPAATGTGCAPDWAVDLGQSNDAPPRVIAANGRDEAIYTTESYSIPDDTHDGTVLVLDAATGATRWTASVWTRQQPAVTRDAILLAAEDGRLVALPARGCGQPTCTPLWEAPLGGPPTAAPVAGGDVVYATVGSQVLAFPAGGCGGADCAPLATVDAGSDITAGPIVHDGRLVVGTRDGRLIAYGLAGAGGS